MKKNISKDKSRFEIAYALGMKEGRKQLQKELLELLGVYDLLNVLSEQSQ